MSDATARQRQYEIMSSVPVMGDRVALTLSGELSELGKLNQSRSPAMLYLLCVIQHGSIMSAKLVEACKHEQVVLAGLMRKR